MMARTRSRQQLPLRDVVSHYNEKIKNLQISSDSYIILLQKRAISIILQVKGSPGCAVKGYRTWNFPGSQVKTIHE